MTENIPIGCCEGASQQNNVIAFLEEHHRENPDKTALQWVAIPARRKQDTATELKHESINYRDLVSRINRIAAGLKNLGITKGDRVIIFVPLSLELYESMFAVQRIGAIAVFLDSWARRDQLGASARVVAPKAMISFEKAFGLCADVPELRDIAIKVIVGPGQGSYAASLQGLRATSEEAAIEPVRQNDTALVTFTTGSSGVPKGANRTHRFLAAQHRALDKEIPYNENDIDLPVFPIFSLNNLAAGVTTVLPAIDLAAPSENDAPVIVNQIFAAGVTCCTVSPSIFVNIASFCQKNNIQLEKLRRVVTGGAPVSKDNVRDFKSIAPEAKILVLYGSTEVEPIAHIEASEMLADTSCRQGVNVGHVSEDLEIKFVRIALANITLGDKGWQEWEVEPGKPGEVLVSGDHVCENYYNNPEAFLATKVQEADGTIWHRTGDVGLFDENKNLWLVGRVHNTIVRKGEYLFPVHPEILLKKLDFVRQAAYVGIEDKELGEKAFAVVALREDADLGRSAEYLDKIRVMLAKQAIPADQIKIVKDIPMDPRHHSKVEYAKLREMIR